VTHVSSDGAEPFAEHLAVVAHELRSPVAALVALAAAAPTAAAADRRRLVELAIAAGRDIERLMVDADPRVLRPEVVDLAALASAFAGERVDVEVAVARALVEGDPTRLRQALANLVANGLRHGTHVRVVVGQRAASVVVDVGDDGAGVDFGIDVFARGASGVGSTGLGLWVARSIAEAHGGSLELVDGPASGASFRLCLPAASGAR
jgi:two-component system, OmpR family, sensor kinase